MEVDFYARSATVVYDADTVQVQQLVDAVNAAGFRASIADGASGRRSP